MKTTTTPPSATAKTINQIIGGILLGFVLLDFMIDYSNDPVAQVGYYRVALTSPITKVGIPLLLLASLFLFVHRFVQVGSLQSKLSLVGLVLGAPYRLLVLNPIHENLAAMDPKQLDNDEVKKAIVVMQTGHGLLFMLILIVQGLNLSDTEEPNSHGKVVKSV